MIRARFLIAAVAMILVTVGAAPPPATAQTKTIELRYASYMPENHVVARGEKYWAQQIEQRSGGRIKVRIYFAEALGKPTTYASLVQNRAADVATVVPGWHPGRFPLLEILNLPFAWPSGDVANRVLYELAQKGYFEGELSKGGLKVASLFATDPYNFIGVRPAHTPKDLQAVKIRSGGGPWTPYIEQLGAAPVSFPTPDLYLNLDKKIIDGTFISLASAYGLKLHEVTKHVTVANMGGYSFTIAMNRQLYASLAPDLQKVVDDVFVDTMEHNQGARYDEESKQALAAFQRAGATIYTPTAKEIEEWKAPARKVIERWIADMEGKGLPGRRIVDDLVSLAARHGVKPY